MDAKKATSLNNAQLKNVKLDGDPILYRNLLDEQYLDSFADKYPKMYAFWLLTSNCGRSLSLLLLETLLIAIIFGFIYQQFDFVYNFKEELQWWHSYYFSFVTMTTLGMASVEPNSIAAAICHTLKI